MFITDTVNTRVAAIHTNPWWKHASYILITLLVAITLISVSLAFLYHHQLDTSTTLPFTGPATVTKTTTIDPMALIGCITGVVSALATIGATTIAFIALKRSHKV